jgi:hypothetical protein
MSQSFQSLLEAADVKIRTVYPLKNITLLKNRTVRFTLSTHARIGLEDSHLVPAQE